MKGTYNALAEVRATLCADNEHCLHTVSQCCALMHTGDCACENEKGCCACESHEPCPEALAEARTYLAFGGITHDIEDLLVPRDPRLVRWWDDRANLLLVFDWMAGRVNVGLLLSKPSTFDAEYAVASAVQAHRVETGHEVWKRELGLDTAAYCNEIDTCGWTVNAEKRAA